MAKQKVTVKIKGEETVGKASKKAKAGLQDLDQSTKKASLSMAASLGIATAAVAAIGVALKIAFDTAQLAARADQAAAAFSSMADVAGMSSRRILDSMSEMAGGTITELDLMLSASRASLLGLPLDKLDDLMKIARASATATGESVQKMFNDIVVGIGRASPMILDNLGITIKIEEATKKYAAETGKVAAALTAAEKKQALLNAVLVSGKEIMDKVGEAGQTVTATEPWQQLTAAVQDYRAEMGDNLLPVLNTVSTAIAENIRENLSLMSHLKEFASAVNKTISGDLLTMVDRIALVREEIRLMEASEAGLGFGGDIAAERKAWQERLDALKAALALLEQTTVAIQQGVEWTRAKIAADKDSSEAVQTLTADQQLLADILAGLEERFAEINELGIVFGEVYDTNAEKTVALKKAIQALVDEGFTAQGEGIKLLISLYGEWLPQLKGTKEVVEELIPLFDNFGRMIEMAAINVDNLAGMEMRAMGIDIRDSFQEAQVAGESFTEFLRNNLAAAQSTAITSFQAIGQAISDIITGQKTLKVVFLDVMASILKGLADELAARSVVLLIMGNLAGAALAAAGALAAYTAAAIAAAAAAAAVPGEIPAVPTGGGGGGGRPTPVWGVRPPRLGSPEWETPFIFGPPPGPIGWTPPDADGGGGGGFGSITTIQRQPDIFITINFSGNIFGAGGAAQAGMDIAQVLREHALTGGQIYIEEAIAPIAGT